MSTSKKEIDNVHRSELYWYFYEDALDPALTRREADFVSRHCHLRPGSSILDLACGHGRHANLLAGLGYRVTGVDLNTVFLDKARLDAEEAGLDTKFLEMDIREVNYQDEFDAALLLYNSWGFFDEQSCMQLLRKIRNALKPGGIAFIDTLNRDSIVSHLRPVSLLEKGEDLMIDRITFDPVDGTTMNRRTYFKDGIRYEAPFRMYTYNYTDFARLVAIAGLRIRNVFGGWGGEPFTAASRRMLLVLQLVA